MSCSQEYCACAECIENYSRSRFPHLHVDGAGPASASVADRLAIVPGYETLASVLDEALEQAQAGKGRERHASGEPFVEQPIVAICEDLGSAEFAVGQAHKKSREALRLSRLAARRELLGAINYLAAAVLVLDRGRTEGDGAVSP